MTELYPTPPEPKKAYYSKTLWVNLLMALASFFPMAKEHLTPDVVSIIFLIANTVLRFKTKGGVTIS